MATTSEEDLQAAFEKARDKQAEHPTPKGWEKMNDAAEAFQAARNKRKASEADDPEHSRDSVANVVGVED